MSFASDQVERLETLMAENPGAKMIVVDGEQIQYDDLLKQYDYWKSRAAREEGTRPRAMSIDLGGF
jgi:hypothetical protein